MIDLDSNITYTERYKIVRGAGVAQWLCNGLPWDGPEFDYSWGGCKNQASRPLQGTVNGGAISK